MILLAVDPSLNRPGFAVLEIENGEVSVLKTSIVDNRKPPKKGEEKKPAAKKLLEIGAHLHMLIRQYNPDVIVREKAVSPHHSTSSLLFPVIGVMDFIAYNDEERMFIDVYPSHVKVAMTGDGKADKQKVASALPYYVGERRYMTDDESDAVAVGLTYAIESGLIESRLVYKTRKKLGRPKKNAPRKKILPHENIKTKTIGARKTKKIRMKWRRR